MIEKLPRPRVGAVRASIAGALMLFGCAEKPTVYDDISVTGWDITQDATVFHDQWVQHSRERGLPTDSREIRNVSSHSEKVSSVCVSYNENGACTLSVPIYDTFYDYESYDTVVKRTCNVEPVFGELTSRSVTKDAACWDARGEGETLILGPERFLVRVVLEDKEGSRECIAEVDEQMYLRTGEEPEGLVADVWGVCQVENLGYPE